MRAVLTEPFAVNLIASPPEVQKAFGKQLTNLLRDLGHPSLRAKKYEERTGLWQARINDDWRMYFTIEGDAYVLRAITPHPKWLARSAMLIQIRPTPSGHGNSKSVSSAEHRSVSHQCPCPRLLPPAEWWRG